MILCCGEALIDMIPAPTQTDTEGFVPHVGGAVFNTAIALGRLETPVGLLSGVSNDLFGDLLTEGLAASHVDASLLIRSDRPTTLAFVRLVDGHATYSFYDENSAGRMITPADVPALPDGIGTLYFGGISLACEPGADAYADLCTREADNHLVMIDPNIRPGFIADEARYRARLDRMMAIADIVKVSDEDLAWLVPNPSDLDGKAAKLHALGVKLVIVTEGKDGAKGFVQGHNPVHVPAGKAVVVDTVGAGDTFNAGVLAKLNDLGLLSKQAIADLSSADLAASLAFGAQVAAITVSRAGANPPHRREL